MMFSNKAEEHLVGIVRFQPTRNKELQSRWDLESGSEVHHCLESKLEGYYYRDGNSLIRATAETTELVGVESGIEGNDETEPVSSAIHVPSLEARVFEVVVDPDERSESVASVLNKLHDEFDADPDIDDVRRAFQSLRRKDVVGVVYRIVPMFRLVVERDEVDVKVA